MPLTHAPTIAVVSAATVISYALIARHFRRVEDLGERVVANEQAILAVLRRSEVQAGDAAARILN